MPSILKEGQKPSKFVDINDVWLLDSGASIYPFKLINPSVLLLSVDISWKVTV